jgi:hypothetical protein
MIGQGGSGALRVRCQSAASRNASYGRLRICQDSVVAYGKPNDQFIHNLPHKSLADRDLGDERNDP